MEIVFIVVLIGLLGGAVISFIRMGLRQRRRTNALAREAHEMGLRFSAEDPFDMSRRYGGFDLMNTGHSLRASNVTYGRQKGRLLRSFDFRCEEGHGTRRMTRAYRVVVAETERSMPAAMMWNDRDVDAAPLGTRQGDVRIGCWLCRGSGAFGAVLAQACRPLAEDGLSMQALGTALMLCLPIQGGVAHGGGWLERISCLLDSLSETGELSGSSG